MLVEAGGVEPSMRGQRSQGQTDIISGLTCTVPDRLQGGVRPQGVEIILYFIW